MVSSFFNVCYLRFLISTSKLLKEIKLTITILISFLHPESLSLGFGSTGSDGVCPAHLSASVPSQSFEVHFPHVGHAVCSCFGRSGSTFPSSAILIELE
jgi:hypothetical protein